MAFIEDKQLDKVLIELNGILAKMQERIAALEEAGQKPSAKRAPAKKEPQDDA